MTLGGTALPALQSTGHLQTICHSERARSAGEEPALGKAAVNLARNNTPAPRKIAKHVGTAAPGLSGGPDLSGRSNLREPPGGVPHPSAFCAREPALREAGGGGRQGPQLISQKKRKSNRFAVPTLAKNARMGHPLSW